MVNRISGMVRDGVLAQVDMLYRLLDERLDDGSLIHDSMIAGGDRHVPTAAARPVGFVAA